MTTTHERNYGIVATAFIGLILSVLTMLNTGCQSSNAQQMWKRCQDPGCGTCLGTGFVECPVCRGTARNPCRTCRNRGTLDNSWDQSRPKFLTCPTCGGTAWNTCCRCYGSGNIEHGWWVAAPAAPPGTPAP